MSSQVMPVILAPIKPLKSKPDFESTFLLPKGQGMIKS